MSTLTRRNKNGTVEVSVQDDWPVSRFGMQGTRGVIKDLHPFRRVCIQREVDHERFLLV